MASPDERDSLMEQVRSLTKERDNLKLALHAARSDAYAEAARTCERLAEEWDEDQGGPDELPDLDHGDRLRNAARVLRAHASLPALEPGRRWHVNVRRATLLAAADAWDAEIEGDSVGASHWLRRRAERA